MRSNRSKSLTLNFLLPFMMLETKQKQMTDPQEPELS